MENSVYHGVMSSTPGQVPGRRGNLLRQTEVLLAHKRSWSEAQRRNMASTALTLLDRIPAQGFCLIGLSGAPGSGKSTLASLLSSLIQKDKPDALVISLDDYYLGKQQRIAKAGQHPLFKQRGVPGTHDWNQLMDDLDQICDGRIENLKLPVFSKTNDDRSPEHSISIPSAPRVVILEGWLVGAPPQEETLLPIPVNQMEADLDEDCIWRRKVNENLARYHHDLKTRLDQCWFMKTPGWQQVIDWRWQQEKDRYDYQHDAFLNSREKVMSFLNQFQRIASHMNDTCRQWADVIINIDRQHRLHIDQ